MSTLMYLPSMGTVCCLLSAAFYTCTNICLRQLADLEADPAWVICLKESITVLIYGPWLLWQFGRGVRPVCPPRALLALFLAALAVQLFANLSMQWALGIVGLVISLPIVFSTSLVGSALIGNIVFQELLSIRSLVAMAMVILSIVLISVGAMDEESVAANASGIILTSLAITAVSVSGIIYAGMGSAIRYALNVRMPIPVTVVVVTSTGTLSLGILCLFRLGPAKMLATDRTVLAWILAAGLCNVIAFSFITKGLQLTTLAHVGILNATQVAFGALAGVLLFREPYNSWLLSGVGLVLLGIGLFGQPRRQHPARPRVETPEIDSGMHSRPPRGCEKERGLG